MSSLEERVLVASVTAFLRSKLEGDGEEDKLSMDARGSLQLCEYCLEAAYEIPAEGAEALQVDIIKLIRNHLAAKVSPEAKTESERLKILGSQLMEDDKYKEALDIYTKAIQIENHNAVFFFNRATAYYKLKDNEQAVKDFLSSLAIEPKYSDAHGGLGLAYTSMGMLEEARIAHLRALQLDPDNESYQTNLRVTDKRIAQQPANDVREHFDFDSLLQNPALASVAMEIFSEPEMQNLITGFIGLGMQNNNAPGEIDAMTQVSQISQLAQQMQQADPDL